MLNQALYMLLLLLLLFTYEGGPTLSFWPFFLAYGFLLAAVPLQGRLIKKNQLFNVVQIQTLIFFFVSFNQGTLTHGSSFFLLTLIYASLYILPLTFISLQDLKLSAPFFLSFLGIALSLDLSEVMPGPIVFIGLVFFMVLLLPMIVVRVWNCTPLHDLRLEELCKTAKFHSRGLRLWSISPNLITAGILGIFPQARYILLTPRLMRTLSSNALEAVVAHEIGHSQKHHLIWLPLILGASLIPLTYVPLIFYMIFVVIYYRFVFGFYSRLFEREADLHGLELNIPIEYMIEALEKISNYSNALHKPNWHHHSLYDRIKFLKKVQLDGSLAKKHHEIVKLWLMTFFISVSIFLFYLYL